MSNKEPMLYRAPADAGKPTEWEEDRFIRLGTLAALQKELVQILSGFEFEPVLRDGMAVGQGSFEGTPVWVTAHLDAGSGEVMWFGLSNCLSSELLKKLTQSLNVIAFDFESNRFIEF